PNWRSIGRRRPSMPAPWAAACTGACFHKKAPGTSASAPCRIPDKSRWGTMRKSWRRGRSDHGLRTTSHGPRARERARARERTTDHEPRSTELSDGKPLRVAVMGTGNWGRVHIEAYWRNPETELVAVCGTSDRERAERMGRQYGAKPYLDLAEMLEKE